MQDIQYTEKCKAISRTPRQAHHLCCWHSRLLLPEPGGHCHLRAAELAATVFELASAGSHTSPVTRPELLQELLSTLHLQMVGVWVMSACQAERHVCRQHSLNRGRWSIEAAACSNHRGHSLLQPCCGNCNAGQGASDSLLTSFSVLDLRSVELGSCSRVARLPLAELEVPLVQALDKGDVYALPPINGCHGWVEVLHLQAGLGSAQLQRNFNGCRDEQHRCFASAGAQVNSTGAASAGAQVGSTALGRVYSRECHASTLHK